MAQPQMQQMSFMGKLLVGQPPELTIPEERIRRDVAYINDGEYKHCMDIYLPTGLQPALLRPVCVHLHGGAWFAGDRAFGVFGSPHMGEALANAGMIGVTPSYRLGALKGQGSPHAHVDDCVAAVRWVLDHISAFGGDPDRVFVSGHSAGGNIAALLGSSGAARVVNKLPDGAIKGVICLSGVYALKQVFEGLRGFQEFVIRDSMVPPNFGDNCRDLHENSPCSILGMSFDEHELAQYSTEEQNSILASPSVGPRKNLPPFLLVNAYFDLGLDAVARRFARLLNHHGAVVEQHVVSDLGTNHATLNWTGSTHNATTDFINRVIAHLNDPSKPVSQPKSRACMLDLF